MLFVWRAPTFEHLGGNHLVPVLATLSRPFPPPFVGVLNSAFRGDRRDAGIPRICNPHRDVASDLPATAVGDIGHVRVIKLCGIVEQTMYKRRSLSLLRAVGAYVATRRGIERINKNDAGSTGSTVTHGFARPLLYLRAGAIHALLFLCPTFPPPPLPSLPLPRARTLTVNRNAASPRISRVATVPRGTSNVIYVRQSVSFDHRNAADGRHTPSNGGARRYFQPPDTADGQHSPSSGG